MQFVRKIHMVCLLFHFPPDFQVVRMSSPVMLTSGNNVMHCQVLSKYMSTIYIDRIHEQTQQKCIYMANNEVKMVERFLG